MSSNFGELPILGSSNVAMAFKSISIDVDPQTFRRRSKIEPDHIIWIRETKAKTYKAYKWFMLLPLILCLLGLLIVKWQKKFEINYRRNLEEAWEQNLPNITFKRGFKIQSDDQGKPKWIF